jgi:hypothetical protein
MFQMQSVESRQMLSTSAVVSLNVTNATSFNIVELIPAPTTPTLEVNLTKTGLLHVTGTDKADKINISYASIAGGAKLNTVVVTRNGKIAATFTSPVKRVSVQGGAGKDIVSVDLKKSVTGQLVGGKGKDILILVNAKPTQTATAATTREVYPWGTDQATIPSKGLVTAYPVAQPTKAQQEAAVYDPNGYSRATASASEKMPTVIEDPNGPYGGHASGYERAWSGKTATSRPAQLVNGGVYDASLINDLLFDGQQALTPSEHNLAIVVRELDGSGTGYFYNATTDKVTVVVEQNYKVHYIDTAGNEVNGPIEGQSYGAKLAIP